MNSATACLHAACIACGIEPGDEVIVSPYTFASSASCVNMVGAIPVFVDITYDTFCIEPLQIKKALTPATKAIIPVHLMGHPADMDEIMEIARINNLMVIEDVAQAIGATYKGKKVGTIGDCGIFSFNQSKHISTGEGGMLITNNSHIARICRAVRNHAEVSDPELAIVGYNYRMCEIEAVLALWQFERLDDMTAHRVNLVNYFNEQIKDIDGFTSPVVREGCTHSYYTYGLKTNRARDKIQEELMKRGVYFGRGYVKPLYFLPLFGGHEGQCPVAEKCWREELMVTDILKYPMTFSDVDEIVVTLKEVLKSESQL